MPLQSQNGHQGHQGHQGHGGPDPLAARLDADAGIEQVAVTVMAIWRDIDQALSPIIGERGVAALFNRSLKRAAATHPWLAAGRGAALDAVDLPALKAALLMQPPAAAAVGGAALFRSFHDLLASLVGVTLTNRLLHAVWAPTSGDTPVQDRLP